MIRFRTVWGSAAPRSAECLRYPNDPFLPQYFLNITVVDKYLKLAYAGIIEG
jgi:hypothetical protein